MSGYIAIQDDRPGVRKRGREVLCTACACLGPFSMGFVIGYSSPAIPDLEKDRILNEEQASWFGSLITLGAVLGGPLAGWGVEAFGRKTTIILCAIPYTFGWLLMTSSKSFILLYIARFLTGQAAGMTSLCVPLYIAETASKGMRGTLGASFQIGTTSGILVVYSLGLWVTWQWLAIAGAIFPTLMAVLMMMTPETPRWLMAQHRRMDAIKVLEWLRMQEGDAIADECADIEENLDKQYERISWAEFYKPALFRPLFVSLALMFFQQFCGINAVIFYTESIFKTTGFAVKAGIAAVIVALVKVLATCVSTLLMDKAGRRILFMAGGLGMTLSSTTFGLYYYLYICHKVQTINYLPLISLIVYVISFSLGWGAVPWLIMSEIFPARARGRASAIATAANWVFGFIVTKEFHAFENLITQYGVFWFFAGICLFGTLFVYKFLPETKGKSLEEIEQFFS